MSRITWSQITLLGVVAAISVSGPALAVSPAAAATPLAAVTTKGGALTFTPSTANTMTLSVNGRNYQSQERFVGGQAPSFTPVDRRGFALPDGTYTWELVEHPSAPVAVAGAGKPANGRDVHRSPVAQGRRLAGSFSVRGGRLVDPSVTEPLGSTAVRVELPSAANLKPTTYDDSDAASGSKPPESR